MIESPDIDAAADVCQQLALEAVDFDATRAINALQALAQLEAQVKAAKSELTERALRGLEQPILIGNTAWSKKLSTKKRPDHEMILGRLRGMLDRPDRETGELLTVPEAVDRAVDLMVGLYVSPSALPKVGGLKALGLTLDAVTREESDGYKLVATELPS